MCSGILFRSTGLKAEAAQYFFDLIARCFASGLFSDHMQPRAARFSYQEENYTIPKQLVFKKNA